MKYTLYDNGKFVAENENVSELLDILSARCLEKGYELNSHRLVDETGKEYPLGSVIIAAGINEVVEAGTHAMLALIAAIYDGYYNTDQNTSLFADEFFYTVGEILQGTPKEKLKLKYLLLDEIEVPERSLTRN